VRVAGLVQQIEDGYTESGPDGLSLNEERELISEETHRFVEDQYRGIAPASTRWWFRR
jgi:polyphosphate kinase